MDRIKISEEIDHQRRRFFGTATKPTQLPAIKPERTRPSPHTQTPVPMPTNSQAHMRTEPSPAA